MEIAWGIAADRVGNVYFAIGDLHSVFKLDPNGTLARIAGNGIFGHSGEGAIAASAQLAIGGTVGIAADSAGNVFIADWFNHRIRKVTKDGTIITVAGNGTQGYSGDGGPATSAQLDWPKSLTVDASGNLYITEGSSLAWRANGNNRVRKVGLDGIITTVAGNGSYGFSGDGGPAISAQLNEPSALAVDSEGNLFIADEENNRIRKVSPNGIITTVAGGGTEALADGGIATNAQLRFPTSITVDRDGNLFIADFDNNHVRKVSPSGIITTVAGNGTKGFTGDGGLAANAQLAGPTGLAADGAGNLFIVDSGNRRLRKVTTDGIISTVAGDGRSTSENGGPADDGAPATSVRLDPAGVATDRDGNLFITDYGNNRIRKVSRGGIITTVAGNGAKGFSGDGGPALDAQLDRPRSLALDNHGNLFISDTGNNRIRKVSTDGIITTTAQLSSWGLAVDGSDNLFIADQYSNRVLRISPDGTITTVAGNGMGGLNGDGGPATSAPVWCPNAVAVDSAGNLFIGEFCGNRVRKVTPNGIINTVAGGGTQLGDGRPATSAGLFYVSGVSVDNAGNIFISTSDFDDGLIFEQVRKVSPDGIIKTVAGTGPWGFSGDGGLAVYAQLNVPIGSTVDSAGNVYIADNGNGVVRILRPIGRPVWISGVVDAASQKPTAIAPGKLLVIYGSGLGPAQPVRQTGPPSMEREGTTVSFNGMPAQILYSSATQVAAIAPYTLTGANAQITVSYRGDNSEVFSVPVAPSSPGLFTANQTGAGQAAALNADGTVNSAANPIKIGDSITLYGTGEGLFSVPDPPFLTPCDTLLHPVVPVSVSIGGIQAPVQCAGRRSDEAAMRVVVQIPNGIQPGGYVPVVLKVGDAATTPGAAWIAVSAK
jgi:uncharacterized protein (TIGR03437 family)